MRLIEVEPGKPRAEVSKGKKYKPNKNFAYRLSCVALCHVMQCDVMWSALMWWAVICCDAMRCNGMASHGFVMRCGWLRCHVCGSKSLCDVATWKIIWRSVLQSTTRYYAILQSTTPYYTLLHSTTKHYSELQDTTKCCKGAFKSLIFCWGNSSLLSHVFLWLLRSSTRVSACFFWMPVVQKGPQK